ncbi:MAG: COR domain-containing protein, partial [Pseudomonadota bacterium]
RRKRHEVEGFLSENRPLAYWARYVASFAGADAPTLLIQSKTDRKSQVRAPAPAARAAGFAQPPAEVAFSARTGFGAADLRDALATAIEAARAGRGETIGLGWDAVKRALEARIAADQPRPAAERRDRLMTRAAFDALCAENGLAGAEPETLLGLLHDLGVLFHRKGALGDRIILDQQWALDAIYAVFNREDAVFATLRDQEKGRFTRSRLGALLWSKTHTPEEQEAFIAMMRASNVCFRLRAASAETGEAVYAAVELLPDRAATAGARSAAGWREAAPTRRRARRFALRPPTLIAALIAEIGEEAGLSGVYWRDGLQFYDAKTAAHARIEMQEDPEVDPEDAPNAAEAWAGRLVIETQGADPDALADALLARVDAHVRRLGLEAPEATPAEMERAEMERGETRSAETDRRAGAGPRPPAAARDIEARAAPRAEAGPPVYISYARAGAAPTGFWARCFDRDAAARAMRGEALDRAVAALQGLGYAPRWDVEHLPNGERISAFKEEIGAAPRVLAILSRKYLFESEHCMPELMLAYRYWGSDVEAWRPRLRVLKLPDVALTSATAARAQAHWARRYQARNAERGPGAHGAREGEILGWLSTDTKALVEFLGDLSYCDGVAGLDQLTRFEDAPAPAARAVHALVGR